MKKLIVLISLFLFSATAKSQNLDPVSWSFIAKNTSKNEVTVHFKAVIEKGWHIYSVDQPPGGPLKANFCYTPSNGWSSIGKVTESHPQVKFDEVFKIDVLYFQDSVVFEQKVKLKRSTAVLKGKISYMACTQQKCSPPLEVEFSVPIRVK